jgi:FtsH-binding integral membrane protein
MNSFDRGSNFRQAGVALTNSSFMSRVYMWMMLGLVLSGGVAYAVASDPARVMDLIRNPLLFYGLIILQFGAVIALSAFINRMSVMFAGSLYLGYAILTGITFSTIFVVYSMPSISQAFFITAFSFAGLSVFGFVTKRDLSPIGSFCMMGLFGLIGLIIVTMIFPSTQTYGVMMTINVASILIFAGLTAYDTQKLKNFNSAIANPEQAKREAIRGALMLYLDFINLFLAILRLTGDRR